MSVRNSDGSMTYTRQGRTITAYPIKQSYYKGTPCYAVELRGDTDLYLKDVTVLAQRGYQDRVVVWYMPDDNNFPGYASQLIMLGAWSDEMPYE